MTHSPLRGIAQVNISTDDVIAARDWYAEFLGVPPYFQRPDAETPAYVEFRIGDYEHELGIVHRDYLPEETRNPAGGAIARWQVDDLPGVLDRLMTMGARENEPLIEREAGFATASVIDPFGNIVGLISSPHYAEILAAVDPAVAS